MSTGECAPKQTNNPPKEREKRRKEKKDLHTKTSKEHVCVDLIPLTLFYWAEEMRLLLLYYILSLELTFFGACELEHVYMCLCVCVGVWV